MHDPVGAIAEPDKFLHFGKGIFHSRTDSWTHGAKVPLTSNIRYLFVVINAEDLCMLLMKLIISCLVIEKKAYGNKT